MRSAWKPDAVGGGFDATHASGLDVLAMARSLVPNADGEGVFELGQARLELLLFQLDAIRNLQFPGGKRQ